MRHLTLNNNWTVLSVVYVATILMFHFSVEECRNTLAQFGVQDITPAAVARVLGKNSCDRLQYISLEVSSQYLVVYQDNVQCTQA